MEIRPVDPRDSRWEATASTYRVYFWSAEGDRSDEYELVDVDNVREVVRWSEEHAAGRVIELFIRLDLQGEPGLVRLAGRRPAAR